MFFHIKKLVGQKIKKYPSLSLYIQRNTLFEYIQKLCGQQYNINPAYIKKISYANRQLVIYVSCFSAAQEIYLQQNNIIQKSHRLLPETKNIFRTIKVVCTS